jgi:hypothetical protein
VSVNESGPAPTIDRKKAETRALASLNQATWEASQFFSDERIREYVDGVLADIRSDEP